MPRLIISTDGLAKARYGDLSTAPDIAVPTAQEISYGYTVSDSPRHKRTYVYLELTDKQARVLAGELDALLNASTDPSEATRIALDVPSVRSAHFDLRQSTGVTTGVVYCGETGVEYDVRELEDGAWNVNDDEGRNFTAAELADALRLAIDGNERGL